ncbi:AraC family ligand binding domain-containing protein [Dictyobacter kobayashii]|uniref:AraC-type arabinose-binding/dimerisation domain-containing protein n=1 Tax=Dictyobacter kobayashii TaxID=2014872 RepID=A0A402AV55_9CHLR|nr:AraC family ligand binding domain-containing protein [Dictyobacter kobayashii]GCE23011.1 hypothetical protein KDK_68110 [Dictyobacter kobayashii]
MEALFFKDDFSERTLDVPPEHIVQSSSGMGWNGLDIAEVVHPHDDFALPAIPRHVLVINLGPPAKIQEHLVGRQAHLKTGNLVILPAGAPTNWHLEREEEVRHLHLYLSPKLIQRVAASADINPDSVELIDTLGAFDPQIESIALSLLSELRSDGLGESSMWNHWPIYWVSTSSGITLR